MYKVLGIGLENVCPSSERPCNQLELGEEFCASREDRSYSAQFFVVR